MYINRTIGLPIFAPYAIKKSSPGRHSFPGFSCHKHNVFYTHFTSTLVSHQRNRERCREKLFLTLGQLSTICKGKKKKNRRPSPFLLLYPTLPSFRPFHSVPGVWFLGRDIQETRNSHSSSRGHLCLFPDHHSPNVTLHTPRDHLSRRTPKTFSRVFYSCDVGLSIDYDD